jgi:hypothetical protein
MQKRHAHPDEADDHSSDSGEEGPPNGKQILTNWN